MKYDANDPKWTAYALGEITDARQKAELEQLLNESPDLGQLVDEIRSTGELLQQELQAEPELSLTTAQKHSIENSTALPKTWFGFNSRWVMACAAAWLILISIVAIRQFRLQQNKARQNVTAVQHINEGKPSQPPPPVKEQVHPAAIATAGKPALHTPAAHNKPEVPPAAATVAVADKPEKPSLQPVPPQADNKAILAGNVMDMTGAGIPGVQVSIVDDATGAQTKTFTNTAGRYVFPTLTQGKHTLTAQMAGFQKGIYKNLPIDPALPTKLDIHLEVASLQQSVEVSVASDNMLLSTSSAHNSFMPPTTGAIPGGVAGGVAGGVVGNLLSGGYMPSSPRPALKARGQDLLPVQRQWRPFNTEAYDRISDNKFLDVVQNPLSTFSIDVDTASYSNMRRFLDMGKLPPKDSIRIEELVNYFDYDYKGPKDDKPFAANVELTQAPWKPEHKLLRIGIKGRPIEAGKRPAGNIVFLLDVSGSMAAENKLPLVKESMRLFVNQLNESDRIAIVVYASATDILLPSTSGDQKEKIMQAIDGLHAGGSTNGGSGIQLAYQTAQDNIIRNGINRVILATDGDFNVGITNRGDLTRLIEEKSKSGIYLSALGFGMGNYKDATLELLAKNGHGNYAYIDTLNEAKKVLVEQMNSTLVPIAKDVKIQVEFNPRLVGSYRLIGYEDRLMAKEDFNDDTKDAGVIGAGHAVTALYELAPAGTEGSNPSVDPLKYQKPVQASASAGSSELATIKIRSKDPEKDQSVLSEFTVHESKKKFAEASEDFRFGAAVAAFGMVLRDSQYKGSANLERVLEWAKESQGSDKYGYRQEFIRLIHRAISISD